MNWNKTVASACRYGDIAARIWGTWDILWEDSDDSYQGHATFLARSPDGKEWSFYEWGYGSCSECDEWQGNGFTEEQVEAEMRNTAMWFKDEKTLRNWLAMLDGGAPRQLINAVRCELGMERLPLKAAHG
jgi:hypothetical protein